MNWIVVNVQLHERRVAILEDGKLVELLLERSDQRRIVGNIYKGVVENIVPGLQAAFVEIGLPKRAFLHVSDISRFNPFSDSETEEGNEEFVQPTLKRNGTLIQNILKRGQEILVQIVRDPIGTKGPRCTTQLTLAGRYIVLIPGAKHIGISRRINDRAERARLRRAISALKPRDCGVIVRTIAKGRSAEVLKQDLEQLMAAWEKVKQRAIAMPPGSLIYRDAGMIPALIRDQFSPDIEKFIIDSKDEYIKVVKYVKQVAPELVDRIELYKGKEPIFDHYGIEPQIDAMMKREVRLPSGGQIVIDQTEALVAIDVNTGKFVGKKHYEDTLLKVNLEAAEEIARQLRLRDLGGLIVIDFIDMESPENISKVEKAFKLAMKRDRAHKKILPMNEFCMLILTRERVQQSIISRLTEICPTCEGVGRIYSPSTMVANIERWLMRAKGKVRRKLLILVHPLVAEELLSNGRLNDFKDQYGFSLTVFADETVEPNKYRIFDAESGDEVTETV